MALRTRAVLNYRHRLTLHGKGIKPIKALHEINLF